ncbi:MAG: DsbA family protein [Dehalococcoidia bacterium]|nr:DsbA family protein [Dehalococcoidia bacterium]
MGLGEVDKLKRDYDVNVRFAPYFLDPTTPPEGKPRAPQTEPDDPPSYMEQRALDSGIKIARGRTWTSNSYLSLQAAEFAADHPHEGDFHRAMFKAYFEDLADIGKVETLLDVGKSVGLEETAMADALESGEYRERVDEGILWARSVGVTGVPTFIFEGQWGIVGAQDYPVFQGLMEKLGQQPRDSA